MLVGLTRAENCSVQVSFLWSVMLSLMTDSAVANLLKENGSDHNLIQSESCFSGTTEAASGHLSVFCFIFSA